jgi:hypothetical protein
MPHVITRTNEFRPGRWLSYAALACAISFVLGLGFGQHDAHQSPPSPCTSSPAPATR